MRKENEQVINKNSSKKRVKFYARKILFLLIVIEMHITETSLKTLNRHKEIQWLRKVVTYQQVLIHIPSSTFLQNDVGEAVHTSGEDIPAHLIQ